MSKTKTKKKTGRTHRLTAKPVDALDEAEAAAELARLAAAIAHHDELYYRKDEPEISDAEYDALARPQRRDRGALSPSRARRQPLAARSAPRRSRPSARCTHRVPMLSLGNVFDEEGLRDFLDRIRRFLGLAADRRPCLHGRAQDRRALHHAALRERQAGPGRDPRRRLRRRERHRQCPHHRRHSQNRSNRAGFPDPFEVQRRDLYEPRRLPAPQRASRRSTANGCSPIRAMPPRASLRQLDPSITAKRPLRFFAYGWGEVGRPAGRDAMGRSTSPARLGLSRSIR